MLEMYKESGITPLEFINTIKKQYPNKKICYTARLDPMARGKIPILFDDECKQMHLYTNLSKTYEVKIMIGYKTDSDDILGMFESDPDPDNNTNSKIMSSNDIITKYRKFFEIENEINIIQKYHYFSTKALLSRNKHKESDKDSEYFHNVKLFSSKIIDNGEFKFDEWCNICIALIDKVDKTKNFRQKEIIKQWQSLLNGKIKSIQYITLKLHVGSGFFVRQFIRDISNSIHIPLLCYDIHRTSIDY
jgi:tRNA U55 pseudouridine synthase TruB